jgi:hypothetical protein
MGLERASRIVQVGNRKIARPPRDCGLPLADQRPWGFGRIDIEARTGSGPRRSPHRRLGGTFASWQAWMYTLQERPLRLRMGRDRVLHTVAKCDLNAISVVSLSAH